MNDSNNLIITRSSMDTSGYKDVVPGRQKLIPRTNKRRQQPVIGITPIPFLCQLIYLSNNNKRNGHTNILFKRNTGGLRTYCHRAYLWMRLECTKYCMLNPMTIPTFMLVSFLKLRVRLNMIIVCVMSKSYPRGCVRNLH